MSKLFSKNTIGYTAIIFFLMALSGGVLFPVVTNHYVLLAVLVIIFIILLILLHSFFDKYVKPIEIASDTMDKILQGNYHARVHHAMNGKVGELSTKINALARNLSELTIQEQMQSE